MVSPSKTYPQEEWRTLLRQKLETAFTLKLRLQDSYKSCCKPPEDPSPQIANNDQTGFLRGRFIGENIRLIDSVINYTAVKKFPDFYFSLTLRKLLTHWNGLLYKKHLFLSVLALPLSNYSKPFTTILKAVF